MKATILLRSISISLILVALTSASKNLVSSSRHQQDVLLVSKPLLFSTSSSHHSTTTTTTSTVWTSTEMMDATTPLVLEEEDETESPLNNDKKLVQEKLDYAAHKVATSLHQLGVVDLTSTHVMTLLQNTSLLIVGSMAHEHRVYHRFHHIIDVVDGLERKKQADPITVLAALFHDVVYAHVDGALSNDQSRILTMERGTIIQNTPTGYQLAPGDAAEQDTLLQMVASIFGVTEGQTLSNEFLSAVVAVRQLESALPRSTLARIAACIEATIPFRNDMAQRLYQNLRHANEQFQLNLSELELVRTVQQAVQLANEDVANFAYDFDSFIGQTMSLLPETNPALRSISPSALDWIVALEKMSKFFDFLQSQRIFHQFQNVPLTAELVRQQQAAATNMAEARIYLQTQMETLRATVPKV